MNSQELLCPIEQQYRPPEGYYDAPYIYVFNYEQPVGAVPGTDPRAGLDFPNLQVPLKGDSQFVLRKAWRYIQTSHQMYTPQINRISSSRVNETNLALVPEMVFPPGSSITFDIFNWIANDIDTGPNGDPHIFHGQFLFQGVRRFRAATDQASQIYPRRSPFRYREEPFSYRFDLPIDWPYLVFQGGATPYSNLIKERDRTDFSVRILDYDFELQWINCALTAAAGGEDTIVEGPTNNFKILLYNPYDRPVFSDFVYIDAINYHNWPPNSTGSVASNTTQGSFPVPGILYPRGSFIRFDVRSMLSDTNSDGVPDIDTPVVRPFLLTFGGVRRHPC